MRYDQGYDTWCNTVIFVGMRTDAIAMFVSVNFRRLSAKYNSISSNERPSVSGKNKYIPMKLHKESNERKRYSKNVNSIDCIIYPRTPIKPNKIIVPGSDINISKL